MESRTDTLSHIHLFFIDDKLADNAIKYIQNQNFGKSFDTTQNENDSLSSVSETVRNQLRAMKDYVIPPKFDFINNE